MRWADGTVGADRCDGSARKMNNNPMKMINLLDTNWEEHTSWHFWDYTRFC